VTVFEVLAGSPAAPRLPEGRGAATAPEWSQVEFRLSLEVPGSFRQLVAHFGCGPWAEFLHVLSPFTSNEHLHFERAVHRQLAALHAVRRNHPNEVPFALYPEEGGLVPWAVSDNGDVVCWLMGLTRFRGHLRKGGYDGEDETRGQTAA
jgi:hypothetical protein